jgi:uncharacterized protein YaaW (UPF0174 family)
MNELSSALALATDDELNQIADILFRRKFNPIDYFAMPAVMQVQSWERPQLIAAIIERFNFLAADGFTVLTGKTDRVIYRQVLERVCQHLNVKYSSTQTVAEIESELFLGLIGRSWRRMSPAEQNRIEATMQSALTESDLQKSLPRDVQRDPISLLLKGGGALAVSTVVKPAVMMSIARQMARHFATYQVGREALKAGGTAIASRFQAYLSTYLAKHGMAVAATQYTAARTVFAVITPALWGLFFADLGWRAIATNYGRIIPVIFTLAQIRLLRAC